MIQYQQLMMIGYEKIRYYTNEKIQLISVYRHQLIDSGML